MSLNPAGSAVAGMPIQLLNGSQITANQHGHHPNHFCTRDISNMARLHVPVIKILKYQSSTLKR